MAKAEYGLQMYSLRDITKDSMRKALEEVAGMGYKYVEMAGWFDYTPEQIKIWLDNFGLVCSGTHIGLDAIKPENIDETIRAHKILGCENPIVPGCDWSTPEKKELVIDTLNFAKAKLEENGMRLGYHNHSREFFPNSFGCVLEDEIIEKTDVELEIDTFWLFNAGIDPVPYLEAHKERIRVIHLKDGIPSVDADKNFDDVHNGVKGFSVGEGRAPIKAIREWAIQNNVLMVIESEGLNPTGLQEVERCINYLKELDNE
ncbi:MAG: sugar phosphate isomerase/epimerase [Clostridia bacterium]|nr:sugar phosphate isomerase/epimerase [Clostridia bacterium]